MDKPIYRTKEDIYNKSLEAIGHTINEYNIKPRKLTSNFKGSIGQIIEEGLFGYPVNSRAEPDFNKVGVELKVTGLRQLKNDNYAAKERLVINMIDYAKEYNVEFEDSSFWHKAKMLLLLFYLYEKDKSFGDFKIIDSKLFQFSAEDLAIIKQDWELIRDKIKSGNAHLMSEGDTMYLGACTKGAKAETSYRPQPCSHIPAKSRAYCLKNSYVNQIVREHFANVNHEKIFDKNYIKDMTFEIAMKSKLAPYFGKSEEELRKIFHVSTISKQRFERYIAAILGIKGNIDDTDEFKKANIKLKTIRVQEDRKIKESMSFPYFKFTEIVKEDWDSSEIRELFYSSKFLFVVFQQNKGIYYFQKIVFWNMPLEVIDSEVKKVWDKTKELIESGNIVKEIVFDKKGNMIRRTNFPKMADNPVAHVRPHGRDSLDTNKLPYKDLKTGATEYTKQCFWLNSSYVKQIVKK